MSTKYLLRVRAVYSFYKFGEEELSEAVDLSVDAGGEVRFALPHQTDGSFVLGAVTEGAAPFAVLTFPNKDNLVLRLGEECEIAYQEYSDPMGDPSENVYEGTVVLEKA